MIGRFVLFSIFPKLRVFSRPMHCPVESQLRSSGSWSVVYPRPPQSRTFSPDQKQFFVKAWIANQWYFPEGRSNACRAHQFGNCWTNRGPLNVQFVWDKPYSSSLVRSRMVDPPCLGFHAKPFRLERNCQQLAGMTKAQTGAVTISEKGEILELLRCGFWAWRKKMFWNLKFLQKCIFNFS